MLPSIFESTATFLGVAKPDDAAELAGSQSFARELCDSRRRSREWRFFSAKGARFLKYVSAIIFQFRPCRSTAPSKISSYVD